MSPNIVRFDREKEIKKSAGFAEKLKRLVPSKAILIPLIFFILAATATYFIAKPHDAQNLSTIDDYQYKNRLLDDENGKLLDQIQLDNDKYYSQVLHKLLPQDRLVALAKDSWGYNLYINGVSVTKDNENNFDAMSKTITVILVEDMSNQKLPLDVARLGSIDAEGTSLDSSVKISATTAKFKQDVKQEGSKTTVIWAFDNVPVGEIISLQMTPNLQSKLGLSNEVFEVFNSKING